MRPIKFDEDIEVIYTQLFEPMMITRAQFQKLVGSAALTGAQRGASTPSGLPQITSSAQMVHLHTGK